MSSVFERLRTLALSKKPESSEKKVNRSRSVGQPQRQKILKYRIDRNPKKRVSFRPPTKRTISKSLMRKMSKTNRDSFRQKSRISVRMSMRKKGTCIKTVDDWIVDSRSTVLPLFLARRSVRQESLNSYWSSDEEDSPPPQTPKFNLGEGKPPSFNLSGLDLGVGTRPSLNLCSSSNGLNNEALEIGVIDENEDIDFVAKQQLDKFDPFSSNQNFDPLSPAVISMPKPSSKPWLREANAVSIERVSSAQDLYNVGENKDVVKLPPKPFYGNNYQMDARKPLLSPSCIMLASVPGGSPSPTISPRGVLRVELGAPDFGSFDIEEGNEDFEESYDDDEAKAFEELLFNQSDWVQPEDLCPILSLGSLGRGAGGGVSGVLHIPTCTVFALKETSYESEIQTFLILQEAMGEKKIPQLMSLHGLFQSSKTNDIALVLEYMNLGSLHDFFTSQGGRCTEKQIRHIARETLLGLELLHGLEIPIIHRDIKPHNILLETEGSIRVADYGLLYCLVDEKQQCSDPAGTRKYFSPERHRGKFSTPSDIWAFGVTMVECLMGEVIEPEDLEDVKVAEGHVNPMDFLLKCEIELSFQAKNFIQCCLFADPEKRWHARQLLEHPFLKPPYPDCTKLFKSCNKVERNEKLLIEILDTVQNFIAAKLKENKKEDVWVKSNGVTHEQRLANICRWTGFKKAQVEDYVMHLYNVRTNERSRGGDFK